MVPSSRPHHPLPKNPMNTCSFPIAYVKGKTNGRKFWPRKKASIPSNTDQSSCCLEIVAIIAITKPVITICHPLRGIAEEFGLNHDRRT